MRILRLLTVFVIVAVAVGLFAAPAFVESRMNRILQRPPYHVSSATLLLHQQLFVADLHADSLLFGRDLLDRSARGHVDIPRLQQANAALQVFSVVTKVPRRLNIEHNSDGSDEIRALAILDRWPPRTWNSLVERALYQAERLNTFAEKSHGAFVLLRSREDLDRFFQDRKTNQKLVAGFLSLEGAHAVEGNVANVDRLYAAGYRMIAPTHFFDTEIGGAAAGVRKGGLTSLGRDWVKQMESHHMIIDLAHASAATIKDVTTMASRPVLVSHTGVKGTCNNNRNLSDDQLRHIARTGGIVGIGFWDTATCGHDAAAIARAIRHASVVIGVDHVALGSDFDGAVTAPFDVTGLPLLTEALMNQGFSNEDIGKIMGGNTLRFLRDNLPN
jgi:membrane dipeptidase